MRRIIAIIAVVTASVFSASADQGRSRTALIWAAAQQRILTQQDLWFQDGEYLACIQLLKVQAEKWPSNYDIWTNLGWMQENVEQWDQAIATYIRYRRQNPQDPDSALPLAFYYSRKRLYAKVPELLEPKVKEFGSKCHPNNYRLLARAYEMQKMYPDSVRIWKAYLAWAPTDGAAKNNLARVEKKVGNGT